MAKSRVLAFETLSALFRRATGKPAAKWQGYLQHYDRLFCGLKTKPLRILEIGIQAGGSLEVWAQYFTSAIQIIGCDKDPACGNLSYTDSRIHVLIGDINAPETLHSLTLLTESLDVVIDDGSHHSEDIIRSFVQLFPRLSDGGIYLIEDLHCSYWESYGGGLHDPFSAISFFKKIVDIINRPMWGVAIAADDFFADFKFIASATQSADAWNFLSEIHSIEFVNSMCIIHKRPIKDNALGSLTLSGKAIEKSVAGADNVDLKSYIAGEISVPDQSMNVFSSSPSQQRGDQLFLAHEEIANLKRQNATLLTQIQDAAQKNYDASMAIEKLTSAVYELTKKNYDSSVRIDQLTTQFYEVSKQYYDASTSNDTLTGEVYGVTKKYYDSSVKVDQLTTQVYEATKKYYDASVVNEQLTSEVYGITKKYYDSSVTVDRLTTQVYEATKKYYEASVVVDQLTTQVYEATKKYYDASVVNEQLTSEVYGVTKKYYDSSVTVGQLTTQVYEATKKYYEASVVVDQLTTQFYEASKKYYEASVTIQQLEFQLNQLEQSKLNPDSDKSQNP
jgi:hypothetical protein